MKNYQMTVFTFGMAKYPLLFIYILLVLFLITFYHCYYYCILKCRNDLSVL